MSGRWAAAITAALLVFAAALMLLRLPIRAPDEAYALRGDAGETPAVALPNGSIDPNEADIESLCGLYGVGGKLAQAIVDERAANGRFDYPEDLLTVKGIGESKLAGFWDQLLFSAQ